MGNQLKLRWNLETLAEELIFSKVACLQSATFLNNLLFDRNFNSNFLEFNNTLFLEHTLIAASVHGYFNILVIKDVRIFNRFHLFS